MTLKNKCGNLSVLDTAQPFDVCIIGSGFAGTVLRILLAKCGVRTLIVESDRKIINWFLDSQIRELAACTLNTDIDYTIKKSQSRAIGGT